MSNINPASAATDLSPTALHRDLVDFSARLRQAADAIDEWSATSAGRHGISFPLTMCSVLASVITQATVVRKKAVLTALRQGANRNRVATSAGVAYRTVQLWSPDNEPKTDHAARNRAN